MSGWWVADLYQSGRVVLLVSWAFWVIFSIVMHELAHGWAALWQGDDTPRRLGRMTWNPLVHMGQWSLIMFALIGIAWGLMPTDPAKYRWRRKGRIVVAAAGPAMNVALALVALTAAAVWTRHGVRSDPLFGNVLQFLLTGGWINLLLAAFNLLPIPPLDGSNILMGSSLRFYRLYQNPQVQLAGMVLVVLVFFSGLGGVIIDGSMWLAGQYVASVASVLP